MEVSTLFEQSILLLTQAFNAKINPHKAAFTQTISRWLVHVLSLAGIDTSPFTTSKAKSLGVPTKEILKGSHWSRASTFQKHS